MDPLLRHSDKAESNGDCVSSSVQHAKVLLTRSRDKYDTMVRVIVGPELAKETFEVYKGVLSFHSDYFRSALNGRFCEAQSGTIRLPTDEAATFMYFKNWMYTREFQTSDQPDWEALDFEEIIRLYLFADCRRIPALANACITLLHQKIHQTWLIHTDSLPLIYENTLEGSLIRRFTIDTFAKLCGSRSTERLDSSWGEEPLRDLAKALLARPKRETKDTFMTRDLCEYHVHQEGVRCE